MRNILFDYLTDLRDRQRVVLAVAKGIASRGKRHIDQKHPASWEFSGFSQNGEDGTIEVLRSALLETNRVFFEIGSADGVQNNTSWLLVTEQYAGLMVEGKRKMSAKAHRLLSSCSIGARFAGRFVTRENACDLLALCGNLKPDLFSLDIDGNDYYVAQALLEGGLRPKIAVLEYNSVFGPERSVTIPYTPSFNYRAAHKSQLYYGVSLQAWCKLFGGYGYRFVTVERNGVNAFFADPRQFSPGFLDQVEPIAFAENRYQVAESGKSGESQFALIADRKLVQV